MNFKPATIYPYKVGDKLKIYLFDSPGNFKCNFGEVVHVKENNVPIVIHKDFSEMPLRHFNRFVSNDAVIMDGDFKTYDLLKSTYVQNMFA